MNHTLLTYQNLYHLFQPVCRLSDRKPLGYEALIRSHSVPNTEKLLQWASQQNQLFELDTLSIYNAIRVFFSEPSRRESEELLFLNVFPSSIAEESFTRFCDKVIRNYSGLTTRMVFEINETMSETGEWNRELFAQNILLLRKAGFRIAFDDVGEGATTLKRIVELSPDFIKIDRFFGKQLGANKKKQHILKFFVDYCGDETMLILEGLEEPDDLSLALSLGVRAGQGYLLTRPSPLPGTPLMDFLPIIDD